MNQDLRPRETLTSRTLYLALDLEFASRSISESISAKTLARSYAVDGRLLLPVEYLRLGLLGGSRLSSLDLALLVQQCGGSAMLWVPP
jgi:hypothetical protein